MKSLRPHLRHLRLLPAVCVAGGALFCLKIASIGAAIGAPTQTEAKTQVASIAPQGAQTAAPAAEPPPANSGRREPPGGDGETEILQALSERRAEIDRRAEEMRQREVLLTATEQRINEKIARLQAIEKTIGESVKKQEEEDDSRLKSLVKIYETMKPREASRILEQLDLPVLLQVLERMKEPKSAPILASMDPGKAKLATAALAERKPALQAK